MTDTRVFLVDDHAVVRAGLKALIDEAASLCVVGEAADGEEALRRIVELRPDVIVTDISMPGLNGAALTAEARRLLPASKVLALTVHEDRAHLEELLKAGACGYVLKRTAAEELVRAIRIVAAGDTYVDPLLAGQLDTAIARSAQAVESTDGAALSGREVAVAKAAALGFSNKEIAAQLDISVKTVETYKARSMEKLKIKSRAELVRFASRKGWLGAQEAPGVG